MNLFYNHVFKLNNITNNKMDNNITILNEDNEWVFDSESEQDFSGGELVNSEKQASKKDSKKKFKENLK